MLEMSESESEPQQQVQLNLPKRTSKGIGTDLEETG